MKPRKITLQEYMAILQTRGRYSFSREEALQALKITPDAFKLAAYRLIKKKRLMRPRHCFYVIVPTEYQVDGSPPVTWYIDSLMRYSNQDYYISLLSASALHGAAHQQPQVFQVITNKPLRSILVGRTKIQFLTKKIILPESYQSIKTSTGYMNVSTPESTAFDIIRYVKHSGHLNNIATILSELKEKIDPSRFKQLLETENLELPYLQRLGYLLELVETNKDVVTLLKNWVKQHGARFVPLSSNKNYENTPKNKDWHLYINENIESDI